jgi:uncharacterized membrane protein YkoI
MRLSQALLVSVVFPAAATVSARDLSPDEARQLRATGVIEALHKLKQTALAQHPGGRLAGSELEWSYGRYLYQADVLDAQGRHWEVELDASNGAILKNHQDD